MAIRPGLAVVGLSCGALSSGAQEELIKNQTKKQQGL